jgi:uncharacterized protein (DUF1800 family)
MTPGLPSLIVVALAASTAVARATTAQTAPVPVPSAESQARAAHVLNRLTFGPRPGDVERVAGMGIDRWIENQLNPESFADTGASSALAGCPFWTNPIETALTVQPEPPRPAAPTAPATTTTGAAAASGTAPGAAANMLMHVQLRAPIFLTRGVTVTRRDTSRRVVRSSSTVSNNRLVACRLARVEASDQQLLEVMTNFWENHFSISGATLPSRESFLEWDRVVIRPNALGRFRDLLGAVARSPAMLAYLDNAVSGADPAHRTLAEYVDSNAARNPALLEQRARRGLNENYGRELLELHTLGVNGGYTQQDVIEVARAFTGWTHSLIDPRNTARLFGVRAGTFAAFRFDSTTHDADAKVVLGNALAAGRGLEDGEQVLDILARHPSTARFIARKLAVRFVSDTPPDALVERAAETFLRTDGDIRAVVRTIVTSPEFFSPDVRGVKIKSPLELVLSMRRALAAPIDTAGETIDLLIALDQPPLGRLAPDGWPETGAAWMYFGGWLARLELANSVADGKVPSIPVDGWPEWKTMVDQPFAAQVHGVVRTILHGEASPGTRGALLGARPTTGAPDTAESRELSLRALVAMALASPEFQRR